MGKRISLFLLGIVLLIAMYLFQRTNWLGVFLPTQALHPYVIFIVNKTIRLFINDGGCFLLIYAIFQERKYIKVAFMVFLFELLIVLPLYFVIKLPLEGDSEISSPLLSQIHRLIVNPTLMLILIMGFFYQQLIARKKGPKHS